jgi:hypothetical protein
MNQPSCEDLRLGKTIEGFSLHSPLGQGPFYRIYGADRGPEEWKIFAWDKLPTPPTEALNDFEQQASRLASLKHPSIIPVVGPFTLPDGAIAWAVSLRRSRRLAASVRCIRGSRLIVCGSPKPRPSVWWGASSLGGASIPRSPNGSLPKSQTRTPHPKKPTQKHLSSTRSLT